MALTFNANTEKVEHGTGIEFGDPSTLLMWFKPTTVSAANRSLVQQTSAGVGISFLNNGETGGAGRLNSQIRYSGSDAAAVSANSTIVVDVWNCVVIVVDSADSQHVRFYRGDLSTPLAEASYSSTANSTGTIDGQGGPFRVGSNIAASQNCASDIATIMFWGSTALTLAQMQMHQFRSYPQVAGCELFVQYGWQGVGTQVDYTGTGNNGTVTGATVADHPPIGQSKSRFVPSIAAAIAQTITVSLDSALQAQLAVSASLDGALQRQGVTATLSLDAAISAAQQALVSLDGALQAAQTASVGLDAGLQGSASLTASLDGALQAAKTLTASLDAALQASRTATVGLDASLTTAGAATVTASLDAALQKAFSVATSLDAALQVVGNTASASLDAALAVARSITVGLDAQLVYMRTVTISLNAALQGTFTSTVGLDASLQAVAAGLGVSAKRTMTVGASDRLSCVIPPGGRNVTIH